MRKRVLFAPAAVAVLLSVALAASAPVGAVDRSPRAVAEAYIRSLPDAPKLESSLASADGTARVVVETRDPATASATIAVAGGTVNGTGPGLLRADVPASRLVALSDGAGVDYVREPFRPWPESPVVDESVVATHANQWHSLGRTGAGVKVAVIDLGFAGYTSAQASGDLPGSVTTVHDCGSGGGDRFLSTSHGTAVASAIHAMAPQAALTLICIADEIDLAAAETYVKANGISIVNHSVGWPGTSRGDGTGAAGTPDAIVKDAALNHVLWVNAAGDQARLHWNGNWAGDAAPGQGGSLDWAPGDVNNVVTVPVDGEMCAYLKWDKWPKPKKSDFLNFDLFLWDPGGGFPIVAASSALQDGNAPPAEHLCFTNHTPRTSFQLKVFYTADNDPDGSPPQTPPTSPRFDLFVTGDAGSLQYKTAAGSVVEPASSPSAVAVGAACWQDGTLDPDSSQGPTIAAAVKPDVTGQDSASNVVSGPAGSCGTGGFAGTSAGAAHVTGAAALVKQANPSWTWTAAQVTQFLRENSVDAGTPGKDSLYGYGRLQLPVARPHIASFLPLSGPVDTLVTITGTALGGTTTVTFGTQATTPQTVTDTKITVRVPHGATTGKIAIERGDGQTDTSLGTFTLTPKVTGFSPPTGLRNLTEVTIDGFNIADATAVKFNGVAAPGFTVADGKINATVPATATSGKISVTTGTGTGTSTDNFAVALPPTITSVAPLSGVVTSTVTVNGTHLDSVTLVKIGDTGAGAIQHVNAGQLKVTVPDGATTGAVSVMNLAGPATGPIFKVTPRVDGFTPTIGPAGTNVEITGKTFGGVTGVKFGAGAATSITPDSASTIHALVPATATTGKITVTTSSGSGSSTGTFTVIKPPTITSLSPTSGPVGTQVKVNGTNLQWVTTARLNGVEVPITPVSSAQLKVTLPDDATTGKVDVTNPAGPATSTGTFRVTPRVDSFSPGHGPRTSPVTITGKTLAGASKVTFNGVSAEFTQDPGTTAITATVPATATTGKIAVTTASGAGSSKDSYTVVLRPTIASFAPTAAATGSTVVLTGTNLLYATTVTLGGVDVTSAVKRVSQTKLEIVVPGGSAGGQFQVTNEADTSNPSVASLKILPAVTSFEPDHGLRDVTQVVLHGTSFGDASKVTFNGVPSLDFHVDSPEQITAKVPPTATTGKIAVTIGSGSGSSKDSFTVVLRPTIGAVAPASGAIGSTVTLTGANLGFATGAAIGGKALADVTVVSSAKVTGKIPAGATSGKLTVTNAADTSLPSTTTFKVTPRVDGFDVDHAARNTVVHVTGLSFTGTTGVKVNGVTAAFTNVTDTDLDLTVPATATTGKVTVTTTQGSGSSQNSLVVVLRPTVTSFSPTEAAAGAVVTVTGTNLTYADDVQFTGLEDPVSGDEIELVSPTKLTVKVPDRAVTGKLTVHNDAGTSLPSAGTLKVDPTVVGYDPEDPVIEGDALTVFGTGFGPGATAKLNDRTLFAEAGGSATQIFTHIPVGASSGNVKVTVGGVTATGPLLNVKPTIGSFTPMSAEAGEDVTITIRGTTFVDVTAVKIGDGTLPPSDYTVVHDGEIDIEHVPLGVNTGAISVTAAGGTASTSIAFFVTQTVTGFAPEAGPVGTSVTITGGGFHAPAMVKFNGTAATTVVVNSATSITAQVPAGATTGKITVTQDEGTSESIDDFVVTSILDGP